MFIASVVGAFMAMEILAYVLHRFVFHGVLWHIHRTHHDPEHGHGKHLFEWNDLFSVGFAAASMALMWAGRDEPLGVSFGLGLGVAIYGVLYFILHDLYTHGRFRRIRGRNPVAMAIKRAHGRHHQSLGKRGQEPYGLFLFPRRFGRRQTRRSEPAGSQASR